MTPSETTNIMLPPEVAGGTIPAAPTSRRNFLGTLAKTAAVVAASTAGLMPRAVDAAPIERNKYGKRLSGTLGILNLGRSPIRGDDLSVGYREATIPEITILDSLFKEIKSEKATSKSVKLKFEHFIEKLNILNYKDFFSIFTFNTELIRGNHKRFQFDKFWGADFWNFIYSPLSKLDPKDANDVFNKAINKLLTSARSNGRYTGGPNDWFQTRIRHLQRTIRENSEKVDGYNDAFYKWHNSGTSISMYFYDAIGYAWNGHKDNNDWMHALPGGRFDGKFGQLRQNMLRDNCACIATINAIVSNPKACEMIRKRIKRQGDKIEITVMDERHVLTKNDYKRVRYEGRKFFTTKQELDKMTFLAYGDSDTRALEAAVYFLHGIEDATPWSSYALPYQRAAKALLGKDLESYVASRKVLEKYKNTENIIAMCGDSGHAYTIEKITDDEQIVIRDPGVSYEYKYPKFGYRKPEVMSWNGFLNGNKTGHQWYKILVVPDF